MRTRGRLGHRLAVATLSALLLCGACGESETAESADTSQSPQLAPVMSPATSGPQADATATHSVQDAAVEQQGLYESLQEGRTEPVDPLPDVPKVEVEAAIAADGVVLTAHRHMSFDSCPWDRLASPTPGSTRLAVEVSVDNHSAPGLVDAALMWEVVAPSGEGFPLAHRNCVDGPWGTTVRPGESVRGWLEFEVPSGETTLDLIWTGHFAHGPVAVPLHRQ